MQMSFPETVSDRQKFFGYANDSCSSCPDNLGGEDAGCGSPGLWAGVVTRGLRL